MEPLRAPRHRAQREYRWELPLLVTTAALGLAAAAMLFFSTQYMKGISMSAENNVIYEVMTTSPELTRLQATIAARFLPGSDVTDAEVALRFAIIENRMEVLGTETSRRLRQDSAEATELIERMRSAVASVAPRMQDLQSAADAVEVLRVFQPLNVQATRLAALTTSSAATRIAASEQKLIDIYWLLLAEILGLLACGIVLIVLLKRTRRKAQDSAAIDFLTGLPNRLHFSTALAAEFDKDEPNDTLTVVMLDLDLFKNVNDTLGHAAGDRLLRLVAERLSPLLSDARLFARLSGDEFAAIFRSPHAQALAQVAARQIRYAFGTPFDIAGTLVNCSVSIGIAVCGPGDDTPEDLLKNADLALYAVKDDRRGDIRLYEPALKVAYLARQTLSKDLESALDNDEFEMHFQPVVSLTTGLTRSFEGLIRWRHPLRGMVSPADFIPAAEETGLILPIGRWVIGQACSVARAWPEAVGIGVNLSARQFVDPQLGPSIVEALTQSGLEPNRLTLEITETALIQNDHSVLGTLNALRDFGVKISLDDFGTGYASLSYLTRFPFDTIKIDQSFVRGSLEHKNSETIVKAICDLAARLGMSTVAEGIETESQRAMVRAAGCADGQGYLFARPMPAAEAMAWLKAETLPQALRASDR
jgi:diguanylate cyclase (GGDEF)-like protein